VTGEEAESVAVVFLDTLRTGAKGSTGQHGFFRRREQLPDPHLPDDSSAVQFSLLPRHAA